MLIFAESSYSPLCTLFAIKFLLLEYLLLDFSFENLILFFFLFLLSCFRSIPFFINFARFQDFHQQQGWLGYNYFWKQYIVLVILCHMNQPWDFFIPTIPKILAKNDEIGLLFLCYRLSLPAKSHLELELYCCVNNINFTVLETIKTP